MRIKASIYADFTTVQKIKKISKQFGVPIVNMIDIIVEYFKDNYKGDTKVEEAINKAKKSAEDMRKYKQKNGCMGNLKVLKDIEKEVNEKNKWNF